MGVANGVCRGRATSIDATSAIRTDSSERATPDPLPRSFRRACGKMVTSLTPALVATVRAASFPT
jgi:hypothetical protein